MATPALRLELPAPPHELTPGATAEWLRLADWAERELRPQDAGLFADYCSASGDLASARSVWAALGCPLFVERAVGPHTGLGAHPLIAIIDGLTKGKLRLATALGLPPPRRAALSVPAADDEQPAAPAAGLDLERGRRFFND